MPDEPNERRIDWTITPDEWKELVGILHQHTGSEFIQGLMRNEAIPQKYPIENRRPAPKKIPDSEDIRAVPTLEEILREKYPSPRDEPLYECDCCERRNVPAKSKGIGYLCNDCLDSWTWDYGRYPGVTEPLDHRTGTTCPFKECPPGFVRVEIDDTDCMDCGGGIFRFRQADITKSRRGGSRLFEIPIGMYRRWDEARQIHDCLQDELSNAYYLPEGGHGTIKRRDW